MERRMVLFLNSKSSKDKRIMPTISRYCLAIVFTIFSLSAFAQSTTEMNALAFKAYHKSDKDPRGAFKMLEAESKKPGFQNADSARIIFAAMHQTGIGTLPDSKKAMRIWKEEADKGSSDQPHFCPLNTPPSPSWIDPKRRNASSIRSLQQTIICFQSTV